MPSDNRPPQGTPVTIRTTLHCPICESGFLFDRLCKRICEVCGYVESCEDSFVPNQANPREPA